MIYFLTWISISATILPYIFCLIIFIFANFYIKMHYINKYVMKYYVEKQIKVRDFVINKHIKNNIIDLCIWVIFLPSELLGSILFFHSLFVKQNTKVMYLALNVITFVFFTYLTIKSSFSIHQLRKWKKINESLADERYLENQIDLNNTEKQIELNSFDSKIWYSFIDKSTNSKFYNKYPSNLNKLSFLKQQEIIYQNAILDSDNTLNYSGEKISINMFRDIFIEYNIINKEN